MRWSELGSFLGRRFEVPSSSREKTVATSLGALRATSSGAGRLSIRESLGTVYNENKHRFMGRETRNFLLFLRACLTPQQKDKNYWLELLESLLNFNTGQTSDWNWLFIPSLIRIKVTGTWSILQGQSFIRVDRSIFNTVFSVIFILLLTFPVNFLSCVLYISVIKLPFVFPLYLLFLCWKFIFFHHFWSVPDCWSIYLLTTLKSFQIFSTAVSFCCWKLLIVFSPASWNCPSFPHGKPFGPVSCKFWMLCYNLPDSL